MATQQEIAKVLHLKTVMPDIVFTGKNKKFTMNFYKLKKLKLKNLKKLLKKLSKLENQ